MQPREKLLLGLVLGGLALLIGNWGLNKALTAVKDRDRTIAGLKQSKANKELRQLQGQEYMANLERLRQRSLPTSASVAKSLYQHWLNQVVNSKDVALEDWKVEWVRTADRKGDNELLFTVRGRGTIAQLTAFLDKFYAADHLHKITQLIANPIKVAPNVDTRGKPKVLDLTIHIAALSLPGAVFENELSDAVSPRLTAEERKAAVRTVLDRNVFDFNQAPRLTEIADQKVARTKELRVRLKAEDPDLHQLSYEVKGLEGARASGGELRWTPPKDFPLGELEAEVLVRDNGVPPRETARKLKITVQNAAPELALRDQRFKWGDEVTVSLRPVDPDGDSEALALTLVEGPPGAEIIDGSQLRWLASEEAGEPPFEIELEVAEPGEDALVTTASFRLSLETPPTPAFNHAQFAVLTRVTSTDGKPEAKINVRTLGETLLLKVGQSYSVGPFKFEVVDIDPNMQCIKIRVGEAERLIKLGRPLWADDET